MSTDPDQPFTLAFVGYATAAQAGPAGEYEDAVLPLLADHGARVVYRARRAAGQDAALPLEIHLLWFPNRAAYDAYLADERRAALIARFGEVFTAKHVVDVHALGEGFANA